MPDVKQLIGAGLTLVLVALSCWAIVHMIAAAQPSVTLPPPAPTGSSGVGRTFLVVRDAANARDIPLTLWYPTNADPGAVAENSPLAAIAPQRAPVIFAVPGLGEVGANMSVRAIELASHGFVVGSMDDVSVDLKGNAVPVQYDLSTRATTEAFLQQAERHARAQAEVVSLAIDALAKDRSPLFRNRLNLHRVGVMGHSIGGAAAAFLSHDPRIAGIVITDGWLYGEALTRPPGAATLMMISDEPGTPTGTEARLNAEQSSALARILTAPNAYYVQIVGGLHGDFTNALYGTSRRSQDERRSIGGAIDTCMREFFALTLSQTPSTLFADRTPLPHVRWMSSRGAPTGAATEPANPSATSK